MTSFELRTKEFKRISDIVYDRARINLHDGKKSLVQSRLSKRLRALGMAGFRDYLEFLEENPDELSVVVDLISTNHTYFFREPTHFDFLRDAVLPGLAHAHKIRLWSAGCASGEEPYTMSMILTEALPELHTRDAIILATDISTRIVASAKLGLYPETRLRGVPRAYRDRYFEPGLVNGAEYFKVSDELKRFIRFRLLNLMDPWPMQGRFNVIFCRNVMIYFDKPTQEALVHRFSDALEPGGHFIVGHSESLTGIRHGFQYIQPSIYMKN